MSFLKVLGALALSMCAVVSAQAEDAPRDHAQAADALASLPPVPLEQRPVVAIYQFRSSVGGIGGADFTDMFVTALVQSHRFRVVERERLNQDIVAEKQLNANGLASGSIAQSKIAGARYIFEGSVSEANPDKDSSGGGVSVYGMSLSGGQSSGEIAIDVRIDDADSGEILDSVSVKQAVKASAVGVSGVGNLIGATTGHDSPVDAGFQSEHHDGVDAAVRQCIEAAVLELIRRVGTTAPTQ